MDAVSPVIRAVRRLQFCAGHRVMNHEGKCANLHGHNYVVFIHARRETDSTDSIGRVIDFSVLKEKVGDWIDARWDHTLIAYKADKGLTGLLTAWSQPKPVFWASFNPTAENMARYLLETVCPSVLEGTGVLVEKIVLWETENCFAEVEL